MIEDIGGISNSVYYVNSAKKIESGTKHSRLSVQTIEYPSGEIMRRVSESSFVIYETEGGEVRVRKIPDQSWSIAKDV